MNLNSHMRTKVRSILCSRSFEICSSIPMSRMKSCMVSYEESSFEATAELITIDFCLFICACTVVVYRCATNLVRARLRVGLICPGSRAYVSSLHYSTPKTSTYPLHLFSLRRLIGLQITSNLYSIRIVAVGRVFHRQAVRARLPEWKGRLPTTSLGL